MRVLFVWSSALVVFLVLSISQAQQSSNNVIRVRYGYFPQARPQHAACARGWLDLATADGTYYKVICYPQSSGGFSASRLDNGQLDISNLGSTPWAEAVVRGVSVTGVYVAAYLAHSQGIYVRRRESVPDTYDYKEIETPFDLEGRTIAVPFGSTMHYQLLFLVDLVGLTGKVNVVNMAPEEILAAWDDNDPPIIDGAGCWGIAREHLLETSDPPAKELVSGRLLSDWGRPTFLVIAASRSFAEEHQAFMEHFVGILSRLNDSFEDRLGQQDSANIARWDGQLAPGVSLVPSVVDSFLKRNENQGQPARTSIFSARQAMETFKHISGADQITCEFLGPSPGACEELTSIQTQTLDTAEFLVGQKSLPDNRVYGTLSTDFIDGTYLVAARKSCDSCLPVGPYFPTTVNSRTTGVDEILKTLETLDASNNKSAFAVQQVGRSGGDSSCATLTTIQSPSTGSFGDGASMQPGKMYSADLSCAWVLLGDDCLRSVDECQSLVQVELEQWKIWSDDFLRVYSVPVDECHNESPDFPGRVLLGQLTGSETDRSLSFKGRGCLLVTFETDPNSEQTYGDDEGSGILMTYDLNSSPCLSSDDCNGETCVDGLCRCGGKKWGADCTHTDYCLGTQLIEIPSGGEAELSNSRQYPTPEGYPNGLNCTFVIKVPDTYKNIHVDLTLDSEEGFDVLHFISGSKANKVEQELYATLSGKVSFDSLLVPAREGFLEIKFTTDIIGRRGGFDMKIRPTTFRHKLSCPPGYHGLGCEFPHCIAQSRLASRLNRYTGSSGRIVSQLSSPGVPAMPWNSEGCVWNIRRPITTYNAVAIRLLFNVPLDLEPQLESAVRDRLVIQNSPNQASSIFVESCDSDEICSFPWQTGVCTSGGCAVRTTVELPISGPQQPGTVSLVTDRNDNGKTYGGVDMDVLFVLSCENFEVSCESNGGTCTDGFCYCEGNTPCSCLCDGSTVSTSRGIKVAIGIVAVALFMLSVYFLLYRHRKKEKSKKQKALILAKEKEIEQFRDSIVGICAVHEQYVPGPSNRTPKVPPVWCWQETEGLVSKHPSDQVFGDPRDGWIKYSETETQELESAYLEQGGKGTYTPRPGYTVDFLTMEQKKVATGFARDVQRTPGDGSISQDPAAADIPSELVGEPQMVLIPGDVIQISKQRPDDGWAYGTKVHHANEDLCKQLVPGQSADIFTDAGWFPLSFTNPPSSSDLAILKENFNNAGDLAAPSGWTDNVDPSVAHRHPLDPGCNEYHNVAKAFLYSLPRNSATIHSIERVQNLALWQSYVVKRATLCTREINSNDGVDTMDQALQRFERHWLWHGTSAGSLDKILQQGFNRSFCGKNATMYGKGVYFARDGSYAASRHYSVPDRMKRQHVLACRVVVGEYCPGTMDALTPDVRDASKNLLYDSTVGLFESDTLESPSILVTYHDSQAYPEYLITFTQKS